jgi:DNA-binding transcriptional LysR family regulator
VLPDPESLRCFEAAATQLSFRVAARNVHLSPAAFSERIRRLEDLLGTSLFARTTRRVTLTAAGLRLLPQARRALAELRACAHVAQEPDVQPAFELVLGTRFELGLSWLVPSLTPLANLTPGRTLQLVFGDGPELLAGVERGTLDAMVSSQRLTRAGLRYAALHEEHYVFVGSSTLLRKTPLRRADHARHHVVMDTAADLPLFRYFLDASPASESWAFQRVELLGTIGAVRQRVLEGVGVAVLPRYLVQADLRARRLHVILGGRTLQTDHFRLVWKRGHALEEAMNQLATQLAALPLR